MGSLTNIWIPEHEKKPFLEACKYYRLNTMAAFFRACATALIEHHEKREDIPMPFKFRTHPSRKLNG